MCLFKLVFLFSSEKHPEVKLLDPAAAAAAAESLQSCPTLCDPVDSSPPGSTVPGIVQAGTLERVPVPVEEGPRHARLASDWAFACPLGKHWPHGSGLDTTRSQCSGPALCRRPRRGRRGLGHSQKGREITAGWPAALQEGAQCQVPERQASLQLQPRFALLQ